MSDELDMSVSLTPREAAERIEEWVVNGSFSGTLIDRYLRNVGDQELYVLVLEKYYMRTSNRSSMTVTIDNFDGSTKVHAAASGSSQGMFFRFDWGAGGSFIENVRNALQEYEI